MRSIPLKAAGIVMLTLALACGDDGGIGPNNPVAVFSQTCTDLSCTFADASTPAGQLTWEWNFGDANSADNTSTLQNPTHVFSAAGDYDVTLTVTNASGATNAKTNKVTVTAPANPAPTASFSVPACGQGVPCTFTSTSTDNGPPVGSIATTHWDFGDPGTPDNTAETAVATHTFAQAKDYTVTLTVTDNGGATNTTSQTVAVLRVAASDCPNITPTNVQCSLTMDQKSQVKITLSSRDCELVGNRVTVQQPTRQAAFDNICNRPAPAEYTVLDQLGATATFQPGAQMPIQFTQGTPRPGNPTPGQPVARLRGTFPDWTISIDDGGNPAGQNEPDFDDVILNVHATVVP